MFFNMKIEDFYQNVVGAVCRVTGIDEYNMLHSNKEACVDARYIFIHLLSQRLTDDEISRISGLSRTCSNKIRNSFHEKLNKYSIQCNLSEINHELATNY